MVIFTQTVVPTKMYYNVVLLNFFFYSRYHLIENKHLQGVHIIVCHKIFAHLMCLSMFLLSLSTKCKIDTLLFLFSACQMQLVTLQSHAY